MPAGLPHSGAGHAPRRGRVGDAASARGGPHGAGAALGRPLVRVEEVASTNDVARQLARAGLPEGTVVVACRQTHGRGRLGRAWASPAGGLWCSVLLRPAPQPSWTVLSLATALAVAEAVEAVAGVVARVRWPNDVVVAGRKVAGILLEAAADALVVGVGINANVAPEALPPEVRARATSLAAAAGRPVDLEDLRQALLGRLAAWYAAWQAGVDLADAWARRDALAGRRITVRTPDAAVEGIADGVAADGALRVRLGGGEVRHVLAGDLLILDADDHRPG